MSVDRPLFRARGNPWALTVVTMNGYVAVFEPAVEAPDGSPDRAQGVGTVHAVVADDAGLPGPRTLCELDTDDMVRAPLDVPLDTSETWFPPGSESGDICARCDALVGGGQ